MMNSDVPDFEMDEDYTIPTTSTLAGTRGENEIMELLWQNGPVAVPPSSQRSLPKSSTTSRAQPPLPQQPSTLTPQHSLLSSNTHLYIAEDEMATWLHCPMEDFYNELLYSNNPTLTPPPQHTPHEPPPTAATRLPDVRPSLPASQPQERLRAAQVQTRQQPPATRNFQLFSRMGGLGRVEPPARMPSVVTVVDSSDTPNNMSMVVTSAPPPAKIGESGEMATMASSSSASGNSTSGAATVAAECARVKTGKSVVEDRKRKRRDFDDSLAVTTTADSLAVTTTKTAAPTATTSDLHSEDIEFESGDEKKHTQGTSATKRSRAAEVHNLSERRRRDRINERMRALQELIPRCNKSDKASMLDEAIEYLKSLQMQVQMMSMGYGMVPMMYPGMQQQYMPPMGMGMAMGVDMGMARPMMPYPPAVPASVLPTAPAAAVAPPLAPRLPVSPLPVTPPAPVSPFPVTPLPAPDLSGNQVSNQAESSHNLRPYAVPSSGFAQFPSMADPFQQYAAFQQMQMQMQAIQGQSQSLSQPGSSKPSSKTEGDNNKDD